MTQAPASPLTYDGIAGFEAHVGEHLGYSDWRTVTQKEIDLFADATGDRQWIHVDPEKAANGPYGKTIAHGYLTLSLVPVLVQQIYKVTGLSMQVNYGVGQTAVPLAGAGRFTYQSWRRTHQGRAFGQGWTCHGSGYRRGRGRKPAGMRGRHDRHDGRLTNGNAGSGCVTTMPAAQAFNRRCPITWCSASSASSASATPIPLSTSALC